jgi:hypothetical protein
VTSRSPDPRVSPPWTREQIRAARLAPLLPLLAKRGLTLLEHGGGNFEVRAHPGLIVKDSYWRWPEHGLQGNAIDFCTQVLRLSFHQAMRELVAS